MRVCGANIKQQLLWGRQEQIGSKLETWTGTCERPLTSNALGRGTAQKEWDMVGRSIATVP